MKHFSFASVALGLAFTASLVFWSGLYEQRSSLSQYRILADRRSIPFLLAGLSLPIPALISPRDEINPDLHASRRIVLTIADSCPFCQSSRLELCALAADKHLGRHDQVLIVSLDGTSIGAELLACARKARTPASYILATARNEAEFTTRTGILETPSIAVTDGAWVLQRAFAHEEFSRFEQAIESGDVETWR